ncbi:MAG: hypothetical protein Q8916_08135 [Bacteroidota bacterium]|nr:hypothetical protein [Bacteroidota bacterium]MDP4230354.1 hypothetical protein [Bacteroidota bacterium]MDP4236252.1 hypothetical protein [Bacteroidota bacterium]
MKTFLQPKSLCLVLFVLALGSCKNSSEPASQPDLIPFQTGNRWAYLTTQTDGNGNTEPFGADSSTLGLSVRMANNDWYFYSIPGDNNPLVNLSLYRTTSSGCWAFNQGSNSGGLVFPYPAVAGSAYDVFLDSSMMSSGGPIIKVVGKVVSLGESVTSPAGTFSCLHYQLSGILITNDGRRVPQEPTEYYISPGVGIVKSIEQVGTTTDSVGNVIPSWNHRDRVLTSYTIN